MEKLVMKMNGIIDAWKERHDIFSVISQRFTLEDRLLCFDGRPICFVDSSTEILSAEFDSDGISYYLDHDRGILLCFEWPDEEPPAVSSVSLVYIL